MQLFEEMGRSLEGNEDRAHVEAFWAHLTDAMLPAALEDVTQFIRAGACDCISAIGRAPFAELPVWKRNHLLALLLGLNADEVVAVKAAASRALGILVLHPCARDDALFMTDLAEAVIVSSADDDLAVRVRATWALGEWGCRWPQYGNSRRCRPPQL